MLPGKLPLLLGLLLLSPAALTAQNGAATAPPNHEYKKVSTLVSLPDFIPGLGTLYVQPSTLPAGPFLGYDRDGRLVNTIYMIPLDALDQHENWSALSVGGAKVDHVEIAFNAGHPGVPEPHYHIILWHVSKEKAASLSQ